MQNCLTNNNTSPPTIVANNNIQGPNDKSGVQEQIEQISKEIVSEQMERLRKEQEEAKSLEIEQDIQNKGIEIQKQVDQHGCIEIDVIDDEQPAVDNGNQANQNI